MPRLREAAGQVAPEDAGLELFDRSVSTWRRLGAHSDLYDVAVAADRAVGTTPLSLEVLEANPAAACRLLAQRYWAWARPAFLASVGALTAEERERMMRWPGLHARPGGGA